MHTAARSILSRRTAVRLGSGGIAVALAARGLAPVAAHDATSIEENKAIIRRLLEETVNRKNLAVVDALYVSEFVDRTAFPGQAPGSAGLKEALRGLHAMFPDLQVTLEAIIAEGDLVAARVTWRGAYAPTGQQATGTTFHLWRIESGKIAELWDAGWEWLAQIDAGPATPEAST